jgi:hypothetical protein
MDVRGLPLEYCTTVPGDAIPSINGGVVEGVPPPPPTPPPPTLDINIHHMPSADFMLPATFGLDVPWLV